MGGRQPGCLPRIETETVAVIAHAMVQQCSDRIATELAHDQPAPRPVRDDTSRNVFGCYCDIALAARYQSDAVAEFLRPMGEIAVHFHKDVVRGAIEPPEH